MKDKADHSKRKFIKIASEATASVLFLSGCSNFCRKSEEPVISGATKNTAYISTGTGHDYQYIVIGSGAGGGPVAARLAEAGFKVLLLEAGGDNTNNNIEIPVFHSFSTEDPGFSWEFFVKHYENLSQQSQDTKYIHSKDGVFYPRAATLGGLYST